MPRHEPSVQANVGSITSDQPCTPSGWNRLAGSGRRIAIVDRVGISRTRQHFGRRQEQVPYPVADSRRLPPPHHVAVVYEQGEPPGGRCPHAELHAVTGANGAELQDSIADDPDWLETGCAADPTLREQFLYATKRDSQPVRTIVQFVPQLVQGLVQQEQIEQRALLGGAAGRTAAVWIGPR